MSLRSCKTYVTCVVALCATASFTAMVLFAGIAAACSGPPGTGCTEKPVVTTTSTGSVGPTAAYVYGDVDPNGCETTYVFEYRKSGGSWGQGGTYGAFGSGSQLVSDFLSVQPSTTYEYRLTASNVNGSATPGAIKSFTTPADTSPPPKPTVTTEAATGITSTGATLNASVNPNGSATTYKFEYGTKEGELNKATAPVGDLTGSTNQKVKAEVSLEPGTKYYFRIWASNAGGTSTGVIFNFTTSAGLWKIKETPNPGANGSYLYDVSCEPSASVCTSVGESISSGVASPVAQRWNGTSWSSQSPAKKSGTLPTRLLGVDCPSETRCLAAGSYQPAEGGPALLTEIWNEGSWNVQTVPLPSGASSSELVAIGCSSTAQCSAVGSAMIGGVKTAVAARWTSPTWTLQTIPIPEGAKSSQLDGVDCLWSNFCAAVGRYTTSGGSIKSLVMFWNGTEWSLQSVTDPVGAAQSTLLDVSCTPSPNRCTAVGGWKNSSFEQFTLAYRFNGSSTWTLQSTPNPTGSIASVFQEVSCASETSCTAAGSWVSSGGGSNQTLAEAWNGTSWSIQGTPNPPNASFSAFFGVSCRSTACHAVGWSRNTSGVDTTMAEFRE
jgi:hypothetical protein